MHTSRIQSNFDLPKTQIKEANLQKIILKQHRTSMMNSKKNRSKH